MNGRSPADAAEEEVPWTTFFLSSPERSAALPGADAAPWVEFPAGALVVAATQVGAGILPIDELWPELVVKKKLSSGASGQVFLVEEKATGDLYALKR